MASTHYTNFQRPAIGADWLNDVDDLTYNIGAPTGATRVGYGIRTVNELLDQLPSVLLDIPKNVDISTVDCRPYFQAAIDRLPTSGGTLVIPNLGVPYAFICNNPTLEDPYRVEIRNRQNVALQFVGNPSFSMRGITTAQLAAISDGTSGGRDIFTCFSFINCDSCHVWGAARFTGQYTGNETFVFGPGFTQARAKCIGFLGSTNCSVDGEIVGIDILGNVIASVHSSINYDAPYKECDNISIKGGSAFHCLENGFNFLGGTNNHFATDLFATTCGASGLESASNGFVGDNCIFYANRGGGAGFSGTGKQTLSNSVLRNAIRYEDDLVTPIENFGAGLTVSGGSDLALSNCLIDGNRYVAVNLYPGVKRFTMVGGEVRNNASNATSAKTAILAAGSAASPIEEVSIKDVSFFCDGASYVANLAYTKHFTIESCRGVMDTATSSVVEAATCNNSRIVNNDFNKTVSTSGTNATVYNNNDRYRITEAASIPVAGSFRFGDRIINRSPVAGSFDGWRAIQSGTFGTLNGGATTGDITLGSNVLTVNSTTGLYEGAVINITGVTGVKTVTAVSGLGITLDTASDATVSGAVVSYRAPVLRGEGLIDSTVSKTYDPPSIAAGGPPATTTLSLTGAALGDFVLVSFSLDLQGLSLTGYVSATNVVTTVLSNSTAGAIDLASGTLRAKLIKAT